MTKLEAMSVPKTIWLFILAVFLIQNAWMNPVAASDLAFPNDPVLLEALSGAITEVILEFRPQIKGHVLSTDKSGVFISSGSENGVTIGMRFLIESPEEEDDTVIQIDKVQPDFSHGLVVSGPDPDLMYGAVYIQDELEMEYRVPDSILRGERDFFMQLASKLEAEQGWKVTSVGNENWQYDTVSSGRIDHYTYRCELSQEEIFTGKYMSRFVLTDPGGKTLEGGITYTGDWIPIIDFESDQPDGKEWFQNRISVKEGTFAIEAIDVNDDGVLELVTAGDEDLIIYEKIDLFLKPKYIYEFERTEESSKIDRGGYLGVLEVEDGWRFYVRSSKMNQTTVCEFRQGMITGTSKIDSIPVGAVGQEETVTALWDDNRFLFKSKGLKRITNRSESSIELPIQFRYFARGELDGLPGDETVLLGRGSIPWLIGPGRIFNGGSPWGAGLWVNDMDGDGIDEIFTTSRFFPPDKLLIFEFDDGGFNLIYESEPLPGRVIDMIWSDFDSDGSFEPMVLLEVGLQKLVLF